MPESRTITGEPHPWQNDVSASGWVSPQWGQNLAFLGMVSFYRVFDGNLTPNLYRLGMSGKPFSITARDSGLTARTSAVPTQRSI